MNTTTRTLTFIASSTMLLVSANAFSQETTQDAFNMKIGVGVSANTGVYSGINEEFSVVPLIMLEYKNFYFQGATAGYRIFQHANGTGLSFEVSRTSDGYKASDANELKGLDDRIGAWEIGLNFETMVIGGQLKANLMQDVSETHEGLSAKLQYERPLLMGATHMMTWYAGGDFWDQERTQYYYGVNQSEATTSRASYKPTNSTNLFVGTNVIKQLSPKFSVLANAQYMMLGEAREESPLVNKDDQWSTFAAVVYQF